MLGSIIGDMVGSIFEFCPTKRTDFPLFHVMSTFTDDTVLTIAVAHALLDGHDLANTLKMYTLKYPNAGYGGKYLEWALSGDKAPYNSFGNGSAMRVSPVGFWCTSADEILEKAKGSAQVTHNHPEGIKGAQAVALAIFMARTGRSKVEIRRDLAERFEYDLDRTLNDIRPRYAFDVTCQGSVPEAIIAFLESESYEDTIRKAISLGGDADTQACIAGGIAEAFYKDIPENIATEARKRLPKEFLEIMERFYEQAKRRTASA